VVCADNTVVIPMRACDRGKSEARGARSAEGAPCEGRFVVRVRSCALTDDYDSIVVIDSSNPSAPVHPKNKKRLGQRDRKKLNKNAPHSTGTP